MYADIHFVFAWRAGIFFVLICLFVSYCRGCVCTFWWGMTGMGESILGVAVGTGAGRLDL